MGPGLEERTEHTETESADGAALEGALSAGLTLNSCTVSTELEKPLCLVGNKGDTTLYTQAAVMAPLMGQGIYSSQQCHE